MLDSCSALIARAIVAIQAILVGAQHARDRALESGLLAIRQARALAGRPSLAAFVVLVRLPSRGFRKIDDTQRGHNRPDILVLLQAVEELFHRHPIVRMQFAEGGERCHAAQIFILRT